MLLSLPFNYRCDRIWKRIAKRSSDSGATERKYFGLGNPVDRQTNIKRAQSQPEVMANAKSELLVVSGFTSPLMGGKQSRVLLLAVMANRLPAKSVASRFGV